MYLLPLVFPFLNLLISCLGGKFLGRKVAVIFVLNMFLCTLVCAYIFYEVGFLKFVCFVDLGNWIHVGLFKLN